MKRVTWSAAALLAVGIAGCGGDSGTSASGGGGLPGASAQTFVEAVIAPGGTAPSDPSTYIYQDALNMEVGQTVQFQLASYDASGKRTVLPTSGWRTSDALNVYGSLAENSGLFSGGPATTPSTYFVGVRYAGKDYYSAYQLKVRQATVSGRVVNSVTGTEIRGVIVEFYDATETLVGRVAQPFKGAFRASVPLNAKKMQILSESVAGTYRRAFTFGGRAYRVGDPACTAMIPITLVTGVNAIGDLQVVPKTAAEPALDGCDF